MKPSFVARRPYLVNGLVLLAAAVLSVAVGAVFIPPHALLRILASRLVAIPTDWPGMYEDILFKIRLPHSALVALVGAALGGSGAAYQGVFRNPLADPYLIGVASGAGLGAILAMSMPWAQQAASTPFGLFTIPLAAFLGALAAIATVYSLARVGSSLPTTTLILAGIAVSSFATALTSYLMLRSSGEIHRAFGWLCGGALLGGWQPILAMLPFLVIGMGLLLATSYALNVLQFGEEQAQQLGLPAERIKALVLLAASLTTAAAVAFGGIIGFVGLIVPHLMRMLWGADYRRVLPLSILGGASMLLLADLLARTLIAPQVLPVGIVTALCGAPFFLWVLRRSRDQIFW